MENFISQFGVNLSESQAQWVALGVVILVGLVLGTLLHRFIMSQIHHLTAKSQSGWDDILAEAISKPTYFIVLSLVAAFAFETSKLPLKNSELLEGALKAAFIVFSFWTVERIIYVLIRGNILLSSFSSSSKGMISAVLRISVLVVAIMMVLDSAGISITPLLASLGVGSIAVALALQDTLSNLFSGLYIIADKPFRIGDYVELEGGVAGYVQKIGWRSTQIKMFSNNLVVVPNTKVASSIITNYDLVEAETSAYVKCGVAYETDLEKAEAVIVRTGKETLQKVQGAVPEFEPLVRYNEFGDSSINLTIILRARKYEDHFRLKHEFIKSLHKAFAAEGIEIPFPQRVVTMKK